ncbi:MAG: cytochrome c biogenesis protein ResB [Oligoflexia bacterium]|nr:cytochrome c biogenesis protein ResB [Oligoflexia bacterium]
MKARRSNPGSASSRPGLLRTFAGPGFSAAVLLAGIGVCVLGLVIPQDPTSPVPLEKIFTPEILYPLRKAGFTDIFHSGWFIFVLLLGVLNLLAGAVAAFRSGSRRPEDALRADFSSTLGKEGFRALVAEFCRGRFRPTRVAREEKGSGELLLSAQEGRFSRFFPVLARVSGLVLLGGIAAGIIGGFEGQVVLNEGAPAVRELQVGRGRLRRDFSFQAVRVQRDGGGRSRIQLFEGGEPVKALEVAEGRPARFGGFTFFQGAIGTNARTLQRFSVEDREAGVTRGLEGESGAGALELPGASVRILGLDQNSETGPSAQLEYREGSGPAERFWVFVNYPKYDAIHRKKSRYVFVYEGARPGYSTELRIVREPGAAVMAFAAGALALFLLLTLLAPGGRYWFSRKGGRISLLAEAPWPVLLEPRFELVRKAFEARLAKAEAEVKHAAE